MLYQKAGVELKSMTYFEISILVSQCKNLVCSCFKMSYPCSEFCGCANLGCMNIFNMINDNYDDEDEDDNLDEVEE